MTAIRTQASVEDAFRKQKNPNRYTIYLTIGEISSISLSAGSEVPVVLDPLKVDIPELIGFSVDPVDTYKVILTGHDAMFRLTSGASIESTDPDAVLEFKVYNNGTQIHGTETRAVKGAGADPATIALAPKSHSVQTGDKLWMTVTSDVATTITFIYSDTELVEVYD